MRPSIAIALSLCCFEGHQQAPSSPVQSQLTFRRATALVPLDIRVIDRRGNPISDLTQRDFTIRENGVIQSIAHFSYEVLTNRATDVAAGAESGQAASPSNRRVILIMMGRGVLELPFNAVSAAIQFVREDRYRRTT